MDKEDIGICINPAPELTNSDFHQSVQWYVRDSVDDLIKAVEHTHEDELQELIDSIFDLPLDHDDVTRQALPRAVFQIIMSNRFSSIPRQAQFWVAVDKKQYHNKMARELMKQLSTLIHEVFTCSTETDQMEANISEKASTLFTKERQNDNAQRRIGVCISWFQKGNIRRASRFVSLVALLYPKGVVSFSDILYYILRLTKEYSPKPFLILLSCVESFDSELTAMLISEGSDREFLDPWNLQQSMFAQIYGKLKEFLSSADRERIPWELFSRVELILRRKAAYINQCRKTLPSKHQEQFMEMMNYINSGAGTPSQSTSSWVNGRNSSLAKTFCWKELCDEKLIGYFRTLINTFKEKTDGELFTYM